MNKAAFFSVQPYYSLSVESALHMLFVVITMTIIIMMLFIIQIKTSG
jgi:hypothetical protein